MGEHFKLKEAVSLTTAAPTSAKVLVPPTPPIEATNPKIVSSATPPSPRSKPKIELTELEKRFRFPIKRLGLMTSAQKQVQKENAYYNNNGEKIPIIVTRNNGKKSASHTS